MFFNRSMFASAKANAGRQNKWYPTTPGRRFGRIIKLKETYGANGNFWIGEFEVVHSDVDQNECGRKFDLFINLANANMYAEKDYGKFKSVEMIAGGIPEDIEITTAEDEAAFGVYHDSLLSSIEVIKGKEAGARNRGETKNLAAGAIVGFNFVTPKGKDGAEPKSKTLRWYPFAPFLPRGAAINQDDFKQVVLEDGTVMDRLEAVLSVIEARNSK